MDASITTLNGFLIVGTSALALWLWSEGRVTVGAIALSTGLVIRINNMSGWIMWVVNGIFENVGTVQDGITTIAQPRAVQDRDGAMPLEVTNGAVHFEHIHFHYGKQGGVIAGLDLAVRAGEKIGVVGPSGAGKSTLVNVLLRLYDLEAGRILIDGQDIADVTQESLRSQIGVVTQDTSLLHRSIRDNLLYGRPDASEAQIAAGRAQGPRRRIHSAAQRWRRPRGYDALVGERGVKLSGGQRQRIAIARVLLKDAPILVLDEATSALDSEAEAAIQDSLDILMQGKTVIAIAHRLSTIARMDRLVVLDKGQIVETGTHAELIAHGRLVRAAVEAADRRLRGGGGCAGVRGARDRVLFSASQAAAAIRFTVMLLSLCQWRGDCRSADVQIGDADLRAHQLVQVAGAGRGAGWLAAAAGRVGGVAASAASMSRCSSSGR